MDFIRRFDMTAGIFVFLVFLVTVYMTKEFLTTILFSMVLVFILKPLYAVFFSLTRRRQISSLFSIFIVFGIILTFLIGVTTVLLAELSDLQKSGTISGNQITATIQGIELWAKNTIPEWIYNSMIEIILKYVQEISDIPVAIFTWIYPIAGQGLKSFASDLPVLFAQLIVAVFITYYILIDGKEFVAKGVNLVPKERQDIINNFLQELNSIYNTLFTVYFSTSMLSGVLAAIGFSLLGVPYPVLTGAVVGIFTLLPMLGAPIVFIPLALYYLFVEDVFRFLILLVFGLIVLMIIPENIIRPHLAMMSSRIHPIVTLLAYTAPVFVIGVIGVFIGPALYGFLLAVYRTACINGTCSIEGPKKQNRKEFVQADAELRNGLQETLH